MKTGEGKKRRRAEERGSWASGDEDEKSIGLKDSIKPRK